MNKKTVIKILCLLLAVVIISFGYYFYQKDSEAESPNSSTNKQLEQLPKRVNSKEAENALAQLQDNEPGKYGVVTQDQLQELINTKANFRLIDIRPLEDIYSDNSQGFIPGSILISGQDNLAKWSQIAQGKDFVTVFTCNKGISVKPIADTFAKAGFTKVYILEGGVNGWTGMLTKNIKDSISEFALNNPDHPQYMWTINEIEMIKNGEQIPQSLNQNKEQKQTRSNDKTTSPDGDEIITPQTKSS